MDVRRGLLALLVLLGACSNQVYSDRPLFEPATGTVLRPGIWATPDPGCRFDSAAPLAVWPRCAGAQVVAPGQVSWRDSRANLSLVDGDPLIVQLQAARRPQDTWFYALGPIRRDEGGRIVEFETWAVMCGPPPPPRYDEAGQVGDEDGVTERPLPGLRITGRNCRARDQAPVRAAARLSRAWDDDPTRSVWVRDGDR